MILFLYALILVETPRAVVGFAGYNPTCLKDICQTDRSHVTAGRLIRVVHGTVMALTSQNTKCRSAYTSQELWKWTLTPDATAPCFILDVLSMPENGPRGIPLPLDEMIVHS
jgi:hypothetical protein